MEIHTNITRRDHLAMQFLLAFRLKANWLFIAILVVVSGFVSIELINSMNLLVWITYSILSSFFAFIVITAFGSLLQIVFVSAEKGFIGPHIYVIDDSGLMETTMGTETRSTWDGVDSLFRTKNYLFVKISGFRVHIIPRSSFNNNEEFEKCGDAINSYINNA